MASSGIPRKAASTKANPSTPQIPSGLRTARIQWVHLANNCFTCLQGKCLFYVNGSVDRSTARASYNCRMPVSTKDVQKKIDALRDKIRYHEHRYYVLDSPEISDAEFDKLMDELIALATERPELITPDSPTQRVGGKPSEEFAKVRHSTPMLSLAKTTNEQELRDWERRVHELTGESQVDYDCELKLDGMSLALRFQGGRLALGLTRGDGTTGEDVTPNIRTVRSVPLTIASKVLDKVGLPPDFEVRGELLMPLAAFQRMNEEREEQG